MVLFMTGVYLVGVFDKLGVLLPLMMATKSAKHFLYCDDQHRVPWVFAMYMQCRTRDPVLPLRVSPHPKTSAPGSDLQLFGFSRSPSSNRITRCPVPTSRRPLSVLDLDSAFDGATETTGSSLSIFSSSSVFRGVSSPLSKFFRYAVRELSSPATVLVSSHPIHCQSILMRTTTSRAPRTLSTSRRDTPNKRNGRRDYIVLPCLFPGISPF
jgi:hypothetical protein